MYHVILGAKIDAVKVLDTVQRKFGTSILPEILDFEGVRYLRFDEADRERRGKIEYFVNGLVYYCEEF